MTSHSSPKARQEGSRAHFEALLHAYLAERADDTPAAASFVALLTAALGVLTLIGFALVHPNHVPPALIAFAPLLALPFAAFGALFTQIAQIRGRIIDQYERDIRAYVQTKDGTRSLIPYGHTILNRCVWQGAFARISIGLAASIFIAGYVVIGILCFRRAETKDSWLAVAGLITSMASGLVVLLLFGWTQFHERVLKAGLDELGAADIGPLDQHRARPEAADVVGREAIRRN